MTAPNAPLYISNSDMVRLIKHLLVYIIFALLIGEAIVRLLHLTSDIPNRMIDNDNIQKYYPNQKGKWHGGLHEWRINELGWAGPLPESYDNLVTILGDSFIENFMNPDKCHQSSLLKKDFPENNFLEAARSGISLIEALEITKQLDSLNPIAQLIYISVNDFEESITEIARRKDITQVNLKKKELVHGQMLSPWLKKILYNWKFMYYLYLRFPLDFYKNPPPTENLSPSSSKGAKPREEILFEQLLDYIVENYQIEDKILIFRPLSSPNLVNKAAKRGFKTILLDNHGQQWSFDDDHHWKCFGHEQAAIQVAQKLKKMKILASEYSN